MTHVRTQAGFNVGFGTPRLKGKLLKPIILLPIKKAVQDPIKTDAPVYIKPIELKPVVPEAIEPPLRAPVEDIIPVFIGEPNEQSSQVHKRDAEGSTPTESTEVFERSDAP
jgi:hypothetical protein